MNHVQKPQINYLCKSLPRPASAGPPATGKPPPLQLYVVVGEVFTVIVATAVPPL
jgi:hypothetical protein